MERFGIFFWDNTKGEVVMDTEQQITLKLTCQDKNKVCFVTIEYAKCNENARLALQDDIYQLAVTMTDPWLVGGDFNVILNDEEKLGGLPVYPQECEDFAFCINSSELEEVKFKESPFTWWNGRAGVDCIFKRLDRVVVNQGMQNRFTDLKVEYLLEQVLIMLPC